MFDLTHLLSPEWLQSAAANAAGTIVGGVLLTLFYFLFGQKLLRAPDLNGVWLLEVNVRETKYNPFRGIIVRYKVLLLQQGLIARGTGEKIYELSDRERVFVGAQRTTQDIECTVTKHYFGRSTVFAHFREHGETRESSWVLSLHCVGFGRRMHLQGQFAGTAGDSGGDARINRIPLPNRVDEYRGLSLKWCGTLFEFLTSRLYPHHWNALEARIIAMRPKAAQFWKENNCHYPAAALVIAEDRRFYSHAGLDPVGLCRAVIRTIFDGDIQGGSTIEQQLVRVLTADYRRSLVRKFKELALAVRLYRVLDKDQVVVAYLLCAYFGWQMNGIRHAGRRLQIDLKNPTLMDAAKLVARIRYPEPKNANLPRAQKIMARENWIAAELERRSYLQA